MIDIVYLACKAECDRQNVGPDRVRRLVNTFNIASNLARFPRTTGGITLTLPLLLQLAEAIEPDNRGQLRKVPVSFKDGTTAIPVGNVLTAIEAWVDWFNEVVNDPNPMVQEASASFVAKEFLDIHPIMDGNGRNAFLYYNWILDTWDVPRPLPYFYGAA